MPLFTHPRKHRLRTLIANCILPPLSSELVLREPQRRDRHEAQHSLCLQCPYLYFYIRNYVDNWIQTFRTLYMAVLFSWKIFSNTYLRASIINCLGHELGALQSLHVTSLTRIHIYTHGAGRGIHEILDFIISEKQTVAKSVAFKLCVTSRIPRSPQNILWVIIGKKEKE